jgi:hypothetical protein
VWVWVYYSAQILFLGAEFTQVYARTYGSRRSEQHLLSGGPSPASVSATYPATSPATRQPKRVDQHNLSTFNVPAPVVWLGTAALVAIGIVQALQDDAS